MKFFSCWLNNRLVQRISKTIEWKNGHPCFLIVFKFYAHFISSRHLKWSLFIDWFYDQWLKSNYLLYIKTTFIQNWKRGCQNTKNTHFFHRLNKFVQNFKTTTLIDARWIEKCRHCLNYNLSCKQHFYKIFCRSGNINKPQQTIGFKLLLFAIKT